MTKTENTSQLRARFWHDRAEEAWSMASQMTDPFAKTMVEIAERYDLLADATFSKEVMVHGRESHRAGRRSTVSPDSLV
jgi:hypothetical protein